jgi:putative transposase
MLDLDQPKRVVLGVLNHLRDTMKVRCVGFVIMPDHVHALITLFRSQELSRFLHTWKRMSSFYIRRWYAACAPHYFAGFGPGDRFWHKKSYVFHVDNERTLKTKLDYIHLNPVRAGLVERAVDWPWSSARWYILGRSVGVPIEWVD